MLRVQFPRVNVKIGRDAFRIQRLDISTRQSVRVNAEICAPRARQHMAKRLDRRYRELAETHSSGCREHIEIAGRTRDTVSIVHDGEDTGIVANP